MKRQNEPTGECQVSGIHRLSDRRAEELPNFLQIRSRNGGKVIRGLELALFLQDSQIRVQHIVGLVEGRIVPEKAQVCSREGRLPNIPVDARPKTTHGRSLIETAVLLPHLHV